MAGQYGYAGTLLRVDLTTGEISRGPSSKYLPKYVGGRGLAARLYWDEISAEVGALDPGNKLIFTAGPLTGSGAAMTSVGQCTAKAPMIYPTSTYYVGSAAGMWAHELKYAGYDGLIIQGKATEPVYLWIEDGHVEIRRADFLWGHTVRRTRQDLMQVHGHKVQVACIGPAGERLVIPSIVSVDSNTAFGQGGFGAVMGSKNLKAIALRGTGKINVADPRGLMAVNEAMRKLASIKKGETRTLSNGKTIIGEQDPALSPYLKLGEIADKIAFEERLGRVRIRKAACPGCFLMCKSKREYADASLPTGSAECAEISMWLGQEREFFGGPTATRLTWEWSMLNDDLGLDAFHTGCMNSTYGVRFGEKGQEQANFTLEIWLEAYKRGILTEANTGLPWSKFGGPEFLREWLYALAYRRGFGDIAAMGSGAAVEYIMQNEEFGPNRGDMALLYQTAYPKSGEFGGLNRHSIRKGHRAHPIASLYAAVSTRRGKEIHAVNGNQPAGFLTKFYRSDRIADSSYWGNEVAAATVLHEYYANEADCAPVCAMNSWLAGINVDAFKRSDAQDFTSHSMHGTAEYMSAVFGREFTQEELFATDEMLLNLERAIWIRDGYLNGAVDSYFDCIYEETGKGEILIPRDKLENLLNTYYEIRGWKAGVPTRAKLDELGLSDVADELESSGTALP